MAEADYTLKPYRQYQLHGITIAILTAMIAVFLNQANTVLGVNFSLSDLFCTMLTGILLLRRQFKLLWLPTAYFILLIVFTLFTSFIYVPSNFLYQAQISSVIVGSFKILVVFIYFLLGYSLSLLGLDLGIIRYYSYTAVCTGLAGLFLIFLKISFLSDIMLFGGIRLKGLMNDPNFFSIVQISSMIYFTRVRNGMRIVRYGILFVFILSIVASGSKTGMITLICYLVFRVIEALLQKKAETGTLVYTVLVAAISLLFLANFWSKIGGVISSLSTLVPSFDRILMIFTDFNEAVSGMGSERDVTWTVALNLIQLTPVFGIGVGTYSGLARKLFGTPAIAHNTYLQLFSEWGILLSLILFLYIFYIIGKAIYYRRKLPETTAVIRDILIVFLIGSLAISLNNARMFWIFLGMLVSNISYTREVTVDDSKGVNYYGHL